MPEEQPTQGQDPQAQPDPTPQAAAPPAAPAAPTPVPAGAGPWAQDLNAIFQDESVRGQVDGFLREKIQPHVTQLEQKAAANADAERLFTAFQEQPYDAYVSVTEEMFGPEAAQQMLGLIQQNLQQQQGQDPSQQQMDYPQPEPQYDERTQSLLDYVEQQQQEQHYEQAMQQIQNDPQYADVNVDALHTFVAAATGDFGEAINAYRDYTAKFGHPQIMQAETPAEPDTPPVVVGSDAATTGTPPVEPKKQSLGDAIEEFVRDSRTPPAPPVGVV